MLRYLIVGTGHSGTGYVSRLLTAAGLPCGHEAVFWANGFVHKSAVADLVADSSWAATYHLDHPLVQKARVVLAVRHPLRVLESWTLKRAGSDPFYGPTAHRASIDDQTLTGLAQLAHRYMTMTRHVLNNQPEVLVYRVEDGPELFNMLEIRAQAAFDNKEYNSHRQGKELTLSWDDLPQTVACAWLRKWAEEMQYQ